MKIKVLPSESFRLWPQRLVAFYAGSLWRGWRFLFWDWIFK